MNMWLLYTGRHHKEILCVNMWLLYTGRHHKEILVCEHVVAIHR